jgi:hypothetical protein
LGIIRKDIEKITEGGSSDRFKMFLNEIDNCIL